LPATIYNYSLQLDDPFWEPESIDCLVGIIAVPLFNITYMEPYDDTLAILNYEADRVGSLRVVLSPCDADGHENYDYNITESVELVCTASEIIGWQGI